ncbi:MAG: DUF362 domain-containing protein [Bacillota bacterium]
MLVNQEKCTGCGLCIPYCPAQAIKLINRKAHIDQEECLECGTCGRLRIVKCPQQALYENPAVFKRPRSIRKYFSDPMATHVETKVPGRGTEEVKTNDVTGRVTRGQVGIAIEVGRPSVAASYRDVEKITMALSRYQICYEEKNPLSHLMQDVSQGTFTEEAKQARVVSAIIEFVIPESQLEEILSTLMQVAKEIDTVFSLDLIARFREDGSIPSFPQLGQIGIQPRPNAKINLGMGRPIKEE